MGITFVMLKTLSKVDFLSLSGNVKSNKIISKFLVFKCFNPSERRLHDSKLNNKSLDFFSNSLIRRTSAVLSSINNILIFLFSIYLHPKISLVK